LHLSATNNTFLGDFINKCRPDLSKRGILLEVLERLKRLEDHCGLDKAAENQEGDADSMSISTTESESIQETPLSEIPTTIIPAGIRDILSRIKDEGSRSMLLSNVFCHLQQVQSCFFANELCFRAITSAMSEIQFMQDTQLTEPPEREPIPKELARQFIDCMQSLRSSRSSPYACATADTFFRFL